MACRLQCSPEEGLASLLPLVRSVPLTLTHTVVELPCSKFPCTCDQTADGAEVSDRDDEREKERVKTERLPTGSSPTTSPPRSGLALVSFRLRVPRSPP